MDAESPPKKRGPYKQKGGIGMSLGYLFIAALALAIGTWGIRKGKIPGRGAAYNRTTNPILFWCTVSTYLAVAVVIAAMAFKDFSN